MRVFVLLLFVNAISLAEEAAQTPANARAADLLKKVEEKYASAKTVQYKVENVDKLGDKESRITYEVAAKSGNRFSLSISGVTRQKTELTFTCVCDGKKVVSGRNGKNDSSEQVPEAAEVLLRASVVRAGVGETTRTFMSKEYMGSGLAKFVVSELEPCPDEKLLDRPAKVLSYTIKISGTDFSYKEKVWIDAESLALMRREGQDMDEKQKYGFVEIYSETKFDEEIADDKFVLPSK